MSNWTKTPPTAKEVRWRKTAGLSRYMWVRNSKEQEIIAEVGEHDGAVVLWFTGWDIPSDASDVSEFGGWCPTLDEVEIATFAAVEKTWRDVIGLIASGTPEDGLRSIAERNADGLAALIKERTK